MTETHPTDDGFPIRTDPFVAPPICGSPYVCWLKRFIQLVRSIYRNPKPHLVDGSSCPKTREGDVV